MALRIRPAFRIGRTTVQPTAYGWTLFFLMIWIPLAALVTANNFLLIIFFMMVGLAVVSHRLAMRNIKSVSLSRRFPEDVFADTVFAVSYLVRSDSARWGSFTLRFTETPPLLGEAQGVTFLKVPPGETVSVPGFFTIPFRGDVTLNPGTISSSFPFGLAGYSRRCGPEDRVLVFPKIEPVTEEISLKLGISGKGRERTDPSGTVPFQFRNYVPGDAYKHIDWKKTAAGGSLITRVLSEEGAREMTIRIPKGAQERAISRAASLVVHFAGMRTPVSLQGPGLAAEAGVGKEHTRKLLTMLARWDKTTADSETSIETTAAVVEVDRDGELVWHESGDSSDSRNQELLGTP